MPRLSTKQIYDVAIEAGFSPHQAVTWTAIARAESGGRTAALNSDHEYSVGLWQINLNAHKDKYGDLHNALNNAKAAYEISNHGKDMRPWTTTHPHNKGTGADYRTYLPEIQKEIGLAGDPRGTDGYGTPLHRQLTDADYERYFATRPGLADTTAQSGGMGTQSSTDAKSSGLDSDGDGLLDYFELLIGTDPHARDSDQDHLTDEYEVVVSHTDPTKADTDGDSTPDGVEIAQHTDPGRVAGTGVAGRPISGQLLSGPDKDHDGLSDSTEEQVGGSSDDDDSDDDGLTDGTEVALGTDPLNRDSNFNGVLDGAEVKYHANPLGTYYDANGRLVTVTPWTIESLTARNAQPGTPSPTPTTGSTTDAGTTATTITPGTKSTAAGGDGLGVSSTGKKPALGVFLTDARAQKGDVYNYSSTPNPDDPDPTRFDCSSLVQWAAHNAGVELPRTAEYQYMKLRDEGDKTSVDEALRTPGALLFYFSKEPHGALPAGQAHVAISLGDGRTIEARGSDYGVGEWSATERFHKFNRAAIVPGLSDPKSQAAFLAASGGLDQDAAVALTAKGTKWDMPKVAGLEGFPLLSRAGDDQSDLDNDGLTKAFEILAGTDPDKSDTDGDGWSDGKEAMQTHTNPLSLDTDGDGVSDVDEGKAGTDAGQMAGMAGVSGTGSLAENISTATDEDHDGVSDKAERTLHTDAKNPDSDGDKLTDGEELALGTDPNNIDTNGDGLSDWLQVHYHLNPLATGTGTDALGGIMPADEPDPATAAAYAEPAVTGGHPADGGPDVS